MQHLVLFLTILLTHPVSDNKLHHQENNVNGQNRFKCGASTCVRGTMCLSCQVNKFNRICVQLLWVMTLRIYKSISILLLCFCIYDAIFWHLYSLPCKIPCHTIADVLIAEYNFIKLAKSNFFWCHLIVYDVNKYGSVTLIC